MRESKTNRRWGRSNSYTQCVASKRNFLMLRVAGALSALAAYALYDAEPKDLHDELEAARKEAFQATRRYLELLRVYWTDNRER